MVPNKLFMEITSTDIEDNNPIVLGKVPINVRLTMEMLLTTPFVQVIPLHAEHGFVEGMPFEHAHPDIPVAATTSQSAVSKKVINKYYYYY